MTKTAPKRKRVTIREVAQEAGVSVAAVSKVLRDAYGVSDALRGKVRETMDRLDYRPLTSARGMRGQTYTLGVILADIRNPFFADILTGLNAALERTQYQPLLGVGQTDASIEEALVDAMMDRQMDGLILVAPRLKGRNIVSVAERIPTVVIGHHKPDAADFDTVNNDDRLGAQLAVRHLAKAGYRDIVMMSLRPDQSDALTVTGQRELGYRDAMSALDLGERITIVRARQNPRDVQVAARRLLTAPQRPEAILCWTDFIALEVISVASALGLAIPGDLAIVGYDNTAFCDLAQNGLTSVDQSGEFLGLQAARLLIERIKGRTTADHVVVKPRVVARRSSMPKSL